jgi:hypothetical protein
VTYLPQPRGDSVEQVLVSVVEPQDSARVEYRLVPRDTTAPRLAWTEAIALASHKQGALWVALYDYFRWLEDSIGVRRRQPDSVEVRAYQRFLARHATPGDRDTALAVLADDPDIRNRMVAASILANFVAADTVVWGLADALVESDGLAKMVAASVLSAFARTAPRPVNWLGAAPTLHAILNGTSLPVLPGVMQVLVETGADTSLAVPLLRGGGEMVLAYLGAQHPGLRVPARNLLVALRGADLGPNVASWRAWILSL